MSVAAFFVSATPLFSTAAENHSKNQRAEIAQVFVGHLAAGEFEAAVEPFDKVMRKSLPPDSLKQIWEGILGKYGRLQRVGATRTEKIQQHHLVFVTGEFERGRLDVKVVFTDDNEIGGLFFVPSGAYQPPDYADPAAFEEVEVTVGKGLWSLPGTLSLPNGDGPFAAVVLVHGSGPHDRDETIGPNKPFRDLAHGLASQGIAVLRYEKRTKHHRLKMLLFAGRVTVKEETVDDAVAAVEVLAEYDRIDSGRIFVLGHSLGGMLLPRIAQASDEELSGLISLAGSTRQLEDLILEQSKYLASLDGRVTEDEQRAIEELKLKVARVKSPGLTEETSSEDLPLGVPASYWLDLRGYDPAKSAQEIQKPMLILHGGRDYQVTEADLARWKEALGSREDVEFIFYPDLNHLFMEGEGKSSPTEYQSPGNVAEAVIRDIAEWIKQK